VYKKTHVI